ncbi:MAG: A/G-specific adenine glycosylase [Nitriliruptoraceae bacterium]
MTDGFSAALLDWWRTARRDLPWRDTRDPWAILVAELMLQQTQVDRVTGPWRAFLAAMPDPAACAAAGAAQVIRRWEGLGYNRRAVHLHAAAVQMVERHDGRVPDDLASLLALPGVGPYTARAVRVFAFERDDAVVDTNVARILARTSGERLTASVVQRLADDLVTPGRGWAHNQAMLDLGARICRPTPHCLDCPVRAWCRWELDGRVGQDPARGSAGVSGGQSRFEGSDRQGRGRLVDTLRRRAVEAHELAVVCGWSDDAARAERVAERLVADGLARCDGTTYLLPDVVGDPGPESTSPA